MNYYLSFRQFAMTFDKETRQKEYHSTTSTFRVMVVTPHIVFASNEDDRTYYDTDNDMTYPDKDAENLIPITKDQYSHLANIEKTVNALFNISMLGNEKSNCRVSGKRLTPSAVKLAHCTDAFIRHMAKSAKQLLTKQLSYYRRDK